MQRCFNSGWSNRPGGIVTETVEGVLKGRETILLVEDEPALRRVAARMLRAHGYQVLEAGDGAEAMSLAGTHTGEIHVLLTDIVLPGIGGRQVAEQVRAERPAIKILFMSGYTDDLVLRQGLQDSNVAFLPKPFTAESLARKVREVLDEKNDLMH